MSKVYIVNFAGHDHREASKYGELRRITTGYVSLGSLDRVLFEVVNAIKDSEPDDWILPSGLLILNVIAAAAWIRRHGDIRMLIWDRKETRYREVKYSGEHIDYLFRNLDEREPESSEVEGHQAPEG